MGRIQIQVLLHQDQTCPRMPQPGRCERASSRQGITPSTPLPTPCSQAKFSKMQNLKDWQPCKCVRSSKWIYPDRGDPGGHLAVECAQPDKKANAWHLVCPGCVSGFTAGLWQGKSHLWSPAARTGRHCCPQPSRHDNPRSGSQGGLLLP